MIFEAGRGQQGFIEECRAWPIAERRSFHTNPVQSGISGRREDGIVAVATPLRRLDDDDDMECRHTSVAMSPRAKRNRNGDRYEHGVILGRQLKMPSASRVDSSTSSE